MTLDQKQYRAVCAFTKFFSLHKEAGFNSPEDYVQTLCEVEAKAQAEGRSVIPFPVPQPDDRQLTISF